jgi:hypothetical protein
VAKGGWSTSAVWFDYDNDGKLDLFVCGFVDYSGPHPKTCGSDALNKYSYCIPTIFEPRLSALYHNNGDGTFTEVGHLTDIGRTREGARRGGHRHQQRRPDGSVCRQRCRAQLSVHQSRRRKVRGDPVSAGVAYNTDGQARSGMGVDSADFDNDGWQDLFVANIDGERFSLYHNDGNETFTDRADESWHRQAPRFI